MVFRHSHENSEGFPAGEDGNLAVFYFPCCCDGSAYHEILKHFPLSRANLFETQSLCTTWFSDVLVCLTDAHIASFHGDIRLLPSPPSCCEGPPYISAGSGAATPTVACAVLLSPVDNSPHWSCTALFHILNVQMPSVESKTNTAPSKIRP